MGSEVGPTVLWGMSSVAFGSLWGSRKLDKKGGSLPPGCSRHASSSTPTPRGTPPNTPKLPKMESQPSIKQMHKTFIVCFL